MLLDVQQEEEAEELLMDVPELVPEPVPVPVLMECGRTLWGKGGVSAASRGWLHESLVPSRVAALGRMLLDVLAFAACLGASSRCEWHPLQGLLPAYSAVLACSRLARGVHTQRCRLLTTTAVGATALLLTGCLGTALLAVATLALCPERVLWWPGGFDDMDDWDAGGCLEAEAEVQAEAQAEEAAQAAAALAAQVVPAALSNQIITHVL